MSKEEGNLKVGKPDTSMTRSAHTRGVRQGNRKGSLEKEAGIYPDGDGAKGTARRSTGINPDAMNPIDPRMPNLSPA